jgi:hypothetical protein
MTLSQDISGNNTISLLYVQSSQNSNGPDDPVMMVVALLLMGATSRSSHTSGSGFQLSMAINSAVLLTKYDFRVYNLNLESKHEDYVLCLYIVV